MIIDSYKPKTTTEYGNKKSCQYFRLNSMLHFYVRHDTILKLIKNYQLQRLDKVLSKYLKYRRSVGEIRDQYEESDQLEKLNISLKNKVNI